MSYRPEDQAIVPALQKIAAGIQEFDAAVRERARSNEWTSAHVDELNLLRRRLVTLEPQIHRLIHEQW
jgi:hypothetical protein